MLGIFIFVFSFSVYAASEGMPQVTDLASPLVNFAIFAGILYWALKEPVKNYFSRYKNNIAMLYEQAQVKQREADVKLDECKRKMKNLSEETARVFAQAEKNAVDFGNQYQNEMQNKMEKFKVDAQIRLKAEKVSLINELNKELVESVLARTKTALEQDTSLRSKAATNLIKGLQ